MKNKWKRNPFFYTALTLLLLFVLLVAAGIGMIYYVLMIPDPDGLSLASFPATLTDNFSLWLDYEDGNVTVEEIGLERLDEYGAWVQVLDESGREIFSHNKPAGRPDTYTMAELVNLAGSGYKNGYTVFVNYFDASDTTLNYILGFPYSIGKSTLYYNGENVARISPFAQRMILASGVVIVLCGFVWSFWLSRKLSTITGAVRSISEHDYKPMKEKGVFAEVSASLNKMDAEIRRSTGIREETDRTRREWISNITHDLITPLSPIRGYAELLTDGGADEQTVREYGAVILKNADHIEKLMNDLKLTYQLEAGAFPYAPRKMRVVRFLREVVIDIINDPAFSGRTVEFESRIPETDALFDPDLLRRAVQNIVVNSLTHNPPGTKVNVTVESPQAGHFTVSVRDDGRGMSETELSNLWTRYYRGTNTEEKPEGSGLGLAIAKQIVTLHGGDITVRSRPGEGTEFKVIF